MAKFRNEDEHVDAIRESPDWRVRALGQDNAAPGAYIGSLPSNKRNDRMGFLLRDKVKVPVAARTTPDLAFPDICCVSDEEEARWLYRFQSFVSDSIRARSAVPFDGRLLFGMVCPGFSHREFQYRSSSILPHRFRQDMRAARAFTGHLVGHQDALLWRKFSPGFRSLWPLAPSSMTEIEVPFPFVVRHIYRCQGLRSAVSLVPLW